MALIERFGVLAHPTRPQTAPIAEQVAASLRARGVEAWCYARWQNGEITADLARAQLVIAIGGDGAMLRAARACAVHNVPVLGIHMGNLGFLTEVRDLEMWEQTLDTLLEGRFWIEPRMMIRVEAWRDRDDETADPFLLATYDALNDVVIRGGALPALLRLETFIDREWATTYSADGLIVATPTGSTAYALACGGPILPPEHRSILIVPVAPHLSLDRSIVLPGESQVEVIVSPTREIDMALSADGVLLCSLQPNDRVRVTASPYISRFVRLGDRRYFYRSLLDRLEPRQSRTTYG